MPLLRKDLRIGLLAGAVLLVLAVVYALVLTFSGSPEPPQVAQAPANEPLEADSLLDQPADDPSVPVNEGSEPASPLGPQGLARAGQAPAGDWGAYGFNGNPPIVTETPPPGSRNPTPADALPNKPVPIDPLAQDFDPALSDGDALSSISTHVVAAGETLSAIAEKYYNDPNLYPLIEKANPRLDARRLKVGQKILIPDREGAESPAAGPPTQGPVPPQDQAGPAPTTDGLHEVVQPGDTLARIAQRRFGREALWEEIYKLNQDLIGPDPARLKPGMKLRMPS